MVKKRKTVYAFVDASNLFYGGEKSLGWKIDYKKLLRYLKRRYGVSKVFYYGGVELSGFKYSILDNKPLNLRLLLSYLNGRLKDKKLTESKIMLLGKYISRVKFYLKLLEFGYILMLKPVKTYYGENGQTTRKANCDVDMTFDLMRYIENYKEVLILSGDGDFVVVLKYLQKIGKKVTVLARGERTAKEIRQLVGGDFRDFSRLQRELKYG